jgi:hypothetical protein
MLVGWFCARGKTSLGSFTEAKLPLFATLQFFGPFGSLATFFSFPFRLYGRQLASQASFGDMPTMFDVRSFDSLF